MRKVNLKELKELALDAKASLWSYGRDVKLYLHWSAGHYGQFFEDYHINIDADGSIRCSDLSQVLSHTWRRNSGSVGIALAACAFAKTNDLGSEPPTDAQIESMARVVTVLADALDLTIDLPRVMTHAEAADNMDGLYFHPNYGLYSGDPDCRWDLAILHTGDEWMSGGDVIRGKANWYRNTYRDGVENHF